MKTAEEAKEHLRASVAYIPDRYRAGVGRADWATPAGSDNAERNFATAIQNAISKKTRQLKVKAVSNSDWQNKTAEKGGAVIGARISDALEKQSARWAPIYGRVQGDVARLADRTVDFRTNITNRVVGTVESWKRHAGKL